MFIVINFLPSTALAASLEIWYIIFLFSIISQYLPFFLVISSLTHSLFCSFLFNFYIFVSLPKFILFLVSNFILLWVENIFYIISVLFFFKVVETCFYALTFDLAQRMLYVYLIRMCIHSVVVDGMFHI